MTVSVAFEGSAPGVIIKYETSNALTISSSATAIPAFAAPVKYVASGQSLALTDFLQLTKIHDALSDTDKKWTFFKSMMLYFMNGGGRCYLIKDDANLAKELARLEEVTLFVQAAQPLTAAKADLARALEDNKIFAILDGPQTQIKADGTSVSDLVITDSENAAAYYPWLTIPGDPDNLNISPSAAVAGVYCRNDAASGPWSTPANVSLQGATTLFGVNDTEQQTYINSINMIRNLYQRNAVVWGGRTTNGNSDDWRYISVKRTFNMLQRDIRDVLRKVVFQPNTARTWQSVRSAINAYLNSIFLRGGLAGSRPENAWFVRVGKGVTMTAEDILNGVMIVEVGVAAVRPAEFIVLRFSQIMGE